MGNTECASPRVPSLKVIYADEEVVLHKKYNSRTDHDTILQLSTPSLLSPQISSPVAKKSLAQLSEQGVDRRIMLAVPNSQSFEVADLDNSKDYSRLHTPTASLKFDLSPKSTSTVLDFYSNKPQVLHKGTPILVKPIK